MNSILILLIILLTILLFVYNKEYSSLNLNTKLIKKLKKKLINTKSDIVDNNLFNTEIKKIPKILFQTYNNKSKIPIYITDSLNKYAPDYKYYLFDDIEGLSFIQQYFSEAVVNRYNTLRGAHKADLLRYCYLYINGGIYADIKTIFIKPLSEIFDHSKLSNKDILYSVLAKSKRAIYQGILATTKFNPVFLVLINKIIISTNIEIFMNYHLYTMQMYKLIKNIPSMNQDIILFQEICTRNTNAPRDRYGYYCKVIDKRTDTHIFDTRDPKFPW
jgi:mannosyltransferase OCH1-like enzyme